MGIGYTFWEGIQIDPETGAFSQATWDDVGSHVPVLSAREAFLKAKARMLTLPRGKGNADKPWHMTPHGTTLVWSSGFGASLFHPSYQVRLGRETVYVHPDGSSELDS